MSCRYRAEHTECLSLELEEWEIKDPPFRHGHGKKLAHIQRYQRRWLVRQGAFQLAAHALQPLCQMQIVEVFATACGKVRHNKMGLCSLRRLLSLVTVRYIIVTANQNLRVREELPVRNCLYKACPKQKSPRGLPQGLKRKRHLHHCRCLDSLLASPRGFEPLSTA